MIEPLKKKDYDHIGNGNQMIFFLLKPKLEYMVFLQQNNKLIFDQ
jgi:hypothetical protein